VLFLGGFLSGGGGGGKREVEERSLGCEPRPLQPMRMPRSSCPKSGTPEPLPQQGAVDVGGKEEKKLRKSA